MGYSQVQKQENHDQILANASRQIREGGFGAINVVALMKSVGLTHGGFYGHFNSKDDLLDQALERALAEGKLSAQLGRDIQSYGDYIRNYVTAEHRDQTGDGCAIAALVHEVPRRSETSRNLMQQHVEEFLGSIADQLDGDRDKASLAMSAMVGALALSRILDQEARADAFLRTVQTQLLALKDTPPAS